MFRRWSNDSSSNAHVNLSDGEIASDPGPSNPPFARSDEIQDERLSGSDFSPCLNHATYIDPDGRFADGERRGGMSKQERLELYNRGNHNQKWTIDQTVKHIEDDWQFCRGLTSQMGLSQQEGLLTWRVYKQMDFRAFQSIEPGEKENKMKQHLVAFCIGALVYNLNHRQYEWTNKNWKYYPGRTSPEKSRRYKDLEVRAEADQRGDNGDRHRTIERCADSLSFTDAEIRECIEKVRSKMPSWSVPS